MPTQDHVYTTHKQAKQNLEMELNLPEKEGNVYHTISRHDEEWEQDIARLRSRVGGYMTQAWALNEDGMVLSLQHYRI